MFQRRLYAVNLAKRTPTDTRDGRIVVSWRDDPWLLLPRIPTLSSPLVWTIALKHLFLWIRCATCALLARNALHSSSSYRRTSHTAPHRAKQRSTPRWREASTPRRVAPRRAGSPRQTCTKLSTSPSYATPPNRSQHRHKRLSMSFHAGRDDGDARHMRQQ